MHAHLGFGTLNPKSCHDGIFAVTGGTGGCRYDNLRCPPMTTKSPSCQLSVFGLLLNDLRHTIIREPIGWIIFITTDKNGNKNGMKHTCSIMYYNMVRWISAPGTMHFRPRYDTFWPCGLFTLLQFCKHPPPPPPPNQHETEMSN